MKQEVLSICIPTRNRAPYLREMLDSFAEQVLKAGIGPDKVVFYISDNASDDQTPGIIKEFANRIPGTICSRNETNIGADRNNIFIRTLAKGDYLWVVGDDEIICDAALVNVLNLIEQHQPGLILAFSSRYQLKLSRPQIFHNYRDFALQCIRLNAHALAEHTLISSNIFHRTCWDGEYGREKIPTFFPHMYGMIRPLVQKGKTVVLPQENLITVREVPAMAVDGQWVSNFDAMWIDYFTWLRQELKLPELDPYAPSEHARRALLRKMFRHPVRFLAANWHSIFNPRAYIFAFNRIFLTRK